MRNWDSSEETGGSEDVGCAHKEDRKSAKACAEKIGIELTEVDFTREYWNDVFQPYLSAFDKGATPNPDLECNRSVKFGSLLEHATERMGVDYLATGHYARIERTGGGGDGEVRLLRGVDGSKDQSYFLASVRGEALKRACFPLGETLKTETREAARMLGLTSVAERRSSAGICFIGRRPFGEFIGEYIAPMEGAFVDVETSQPVRDAPRHRGLASYTVGQRAKIPGASRPWFVVGKNVAANVVYVASGSDHDALFSSSCVVADEFWVAGRRPSAADGFRAFPRQGALRLPAHPDRRSRRRSI
jgi:tRNA-specific 2-thiouridylase